MVYYTLLFYRTLLIVLQLGDTLVMGYRQTFSIGWMKQRLQGQEMALVLLYRGHMLVTFGKLSRLRLGMTQKWSQLAVLVGINASYCYEDYM